MPQVCRSCGLTNLDTASLCDCGSDFSGITHNPSCARLKTPAPSIQDIRPLAAALILLILFVLVGCFYFPLLNDQARDTSIPRLIETCIIIVLDKAIIGLLCGGIAGIVLSAFNKAGNRPLSANVTRVILIVTAITVFLLTWKDGVRYLGSKPLPQPSPTSFQTPTLDLYSSAEQTRLQEIVANTMNNPEFLTPTTHKEFWNILARPFHIRPEAIPAEAFTPMQKTISDFARNYQRAFWEDALKAISLKRSYESLEREQLEREGVGGQLIPSWRLQQNQELMQHIANQEPVSMKGMSIVFTKEVIRDILSNVDQTAERINQLFRPPTEVSP